MRLMSYAAKRGPQAHFLALFFQFHFIHTGPARSRTMLETGRRAHASHSLRLKRIDWNTLTVPGKREDVDIDTFTPETETWFRAKCNLVYQHPSVVLVEKVVVKSDTDMKNKVGQKSTKEPGEPKGATRSGLPPGPWETSYVTRRLELSTGKVSRTITTNTTS